MSVVKMKKRIWVILVSVAAVFLGTLGFPENIYAYNKDVSSGVVPVVFYVDDGAQVVVDTSTGKIADEGKHFSIGEVSGGTGFFVGPEGEDPQFIVTNCHVVEEYIGYGEGQICYIPQQYYMPETYGDRYTQGLALYKYELRVYYSENDYDVAYVDSAGDTEKVDLALLRIKDPTNKRHPLKIMIPKDDMVGETVYTVGFPGNADNQFTSASKYGVDDVTVHKGSITKFAANSGVGVERIQIDAVVQHGNSGGPLVTEEGYVIGVNTNVESKSPYAEQIESDFYAINASVLARQLDIWKVDYDLVSADAEGDNGETGSDEAASETPEETAEAQPEDTAEAQSEDAVEAQSEDAVEAQPEDTAEAKPEDTAKAGLLNNKMFLLGGIGVVVLVLVAILVVVLSKKKKTPAPIQPMAAPQTPSPLAAHAPAPKKAMIRSLSMQHNGMTVALHNGSQVMIGRDPANCKIVFREGTEGISGRHCSVSYDPATDEFILTDLKSTYGTFLMNGQKLNPNVPYRLKAGDGFYAGTQENSFRVELG